MRILHVIPYMHPDAGGPPVVVENIICGTNALGFRSEIVSTPQFCRGDEAELLRRLNQLATTTFLDKGGRLSALLGSCAKELAESIQTTDVVHVHTLWSPYNLMVRQECARCHRPYVLMPHGMLDPYSMSVRGWRKFAYFCAIERKNIALARKVIFTTEEEANLAAKTIGPHPGRVVIPLGGDGGIPPPEENARAAHEFCTRYPRTNGRRRVLFLGRLHHKKGLDRILRAMPQVAKNIPEVLLVIAGEGDAAYKRELEQLIATLGLESRVMMVGRLDGRMKWGAYASSEVFILPSRQENFAISVAEAMHAGLPLIVTDKVNTWPYVVEANAGVVIAENDVERELGKQIIRLLGNEPSVSRMGEQGREYAQGYLTWSTAVAKFAECYQNALED